MKLTSFTDYSLRVLIFLAVQPERRATIAEIAKAVGNASINASMYLDSHPQTNQVLKAVAAQPAGPQSLATLKAYFDANPQAATDLQVIQRPVTALTTKCKLPISLPQVLGLMQGVQQTAPQAPAQVLSAS